MATYVFECKTHGEKEVSRPMAQAGDPATCPQCLLDVADELNQRGAFDGLTWQQIFDAIWEATPPMRRLFGFGVLVQNHSVSDEQGGNLRSFGQHERLVQTNINDWIASERRRRLERESDK